MPYGKKEIQSLMDMKLHEIQRIAVSGIILSILRVPGGWIYSQSLCGATSVFVPYTSDLDNGRRI